MIEQKIKPYYTLLACKNCGKVRPVRNDKPKKSNYTGLCPACSMSLISRTVYSGEANGNWKLGRVNMSGGYIGIRVYRDNPFFPMADNSNYILEHRLVMAQALGRCLRSWEIIHHKNGDKKDNNLSNLEMLPSKASRQTHMAFTILQKENETLRHENNFLWHKFYKALGGKK